MSTKRPTSNQRDTSNDGYTIWDDIGAMAIDKPRQSCHEAPRSATKRHEAYRACDRLNVSSASMITPLHVANYRERI